MSWKQSILLLALQTLLWVDAAAAQSLISDATRNLPIANEVNIGGGGWAQIYNQAELAAFAIDVVVALALATLIALHPMRRAARSKTIDFILPRLFAFYALIGMVVGFLVDQHGYIIGFVVFGIGALLRFRSNLDDPVDTVEMILVTVLGLCVGLDLPVMAILIGAVSWVLIWVSGRRLPIELRLQADSMERLEHALDRVHQIARQEQWKEGYLHRSHSKNTARMIFLLHASIGEEGVETALQKGLEGEGLIWKVGN
ncbi:hypothetical protein [Tateyamaria sp.]|uniref:hypothetical protein n=1 Tax=Tateyamaria sp. TaxID=1929288 RepID=UPI00329F0268